MKKILFICNNLPNNLDAGGILYQNILRQYGLENFNLISVSYKIDLAEVPKDFQEVPFNQYSLRFSRSNIFLKMLNKVPLITTLLILIKYSFIRNEIIRVCQEKEFDMIFAPLRGDVLLLLNDILKATRLPLYSMVEDTVEREIDDHVSLYKFKRRNYYKILPHVKKLGVAGETMKEYFKSKFQIDSIILRPSFLNFTESLDKKIKDHFNILFAGNVYAKNEMDCFIKSLNTFAIRNEEIKINLFVAAHCSFKSKSDKFSITNIGWIKEDLLERYMKICHISYLPYKTDRKFEHSMKYAFPGKAGFYISNNLPIFFHGPIYSSFNNFLTKYTVGISCDSMDTAIISNELSRFVSSPSFYSLCQNECRKAYYNEFNHEIFSRKVNEFFGDE